MYILAMIVMLGAASGLLILQTAQNFDISFTEEEKAAMRAAFEDFKERLKNGLPNRRRNNRRT